MARTGRVLLALIVPWLTPCLAFEAKLRHPDGAPVADALVSIPGRAGSTRTDRNGAFVWLPDPTPPFHIIVTPRGETMMAPILIDALPSGEPLLLTVAPLQTESVTVTAEAAPHTETSPASALNMLPREDLRQRHPERLVDAVENLPGVSRLGSGHDAVPSIRGLARGRTLILIDGARVTTERRAGPSASYLDPFFLETVEVSRGPGSVAYGSDALGGVIHARTPRPVPGSPLQFRLAGDLGAGIPQRGLGVSMSKGSETGGFLLQARLRTFGDYRSPDGTIDNSSAESSGFLGRFESETGPGTLSVGWQSDLGRDIERPSTSSSLTSEPREDSHRLTFSYQLDPFADATLTSVQGYAGTYRLVTQRDAAGSGPVSRSDVRARDAGLRALTVLPRERTRLEVGVDLNGRFGLEAVDSQGGAETQAIEDARRFDAGTYVTGEAKLGQALAANGAIRFDRVTTRNSGGVHGDASTSHDALSGFVALTAGPVGAATVTLQIARGFRDPSLSDRYFAGTSGRGFVIGNPGLDPESSLQLDLALRWRLRRWHGALYAYRYHIDDLIERYESRSVPELFFFRNRGLARLQGIEAEARVELGGSTTIEIGAQLARGEAEDGSPLADIPAANLTLQLRRAVLGRGYLEARAALFARDEDAGPTEMVTPGYGLVDVGTGWSVTPDLEIRLLLRNLLDARYPASVDGNAVTAPGRSALLAVTARMGA